MTTVSRGRLRSPHDAPLEGELTEPVTRMGGVIIEQIVSGMLPLPVDYRQPHDEWVLLLSGRAVVEVDGLPQELEPGEWLFLPANVSHRLVETEPASSWLTVNATG